MQGATIWRTIPSSESISLGTLAVFIEPSLYLLAGDGVWGRGRRWAAEREKRTVVKAGNLNALHVRRICCWQPQARSRTPDAGSGQCSSACHPGSGVFFSRTEPVKLPGRFYTQWDLTNGQPVYRFVAGAAISIYEHKLEALLNGAPRQALNASFTSLKIVRRC